MGRILDEFLKKHNLSDTTALAFIRVGSLAVLTDDDVPIDVKARMEELEHDAHKVLDNLALIMFSTRGGLTLDPDSKNH